MVNSQAILKNGIRIELTHETNPIIKNTRPIMAIPTTRLLRSVDEERDCLFIYSAFVNNVLLGDCMISCY